MTKAFSKIKKALLESIAHAQGEPAPGTVIHERKVPNATTIAAMKEGLRLSRRPGKSIKEIFRELDAIQKRGSR